MWVREQAWEGHSRRWLCLFALLLAGLLWRRAGERDGVERREQCRRRSWQWREVMRTDVERRREGTALGAGGAGVQADGIVGGWKVRCRLLWALL